MAASEKRPSLTKRQREIYEYLKDRIQNRGFGPTVREIGDNFGIKSPNGVMCHLKALEKKGLITRESNMSRAICLCEDTSGHFSVPHIGTAVSGRAIKAAVSSDDHVEFEDIFRGDDRACITVEGSCFTPLCILDGDSIVVSRTEPGEPGNLMAGLDDRHNVALYRIQPGGKAPIPAISGVYAAPPRQILGTVVSVIRQFPKIGSALPSPATEEAGRDAGESTGADRRYTGADRRYTEAAFV